MPKMDGLTATRRIRALERARPADDRTPAAHIVALTAHSDASDECLGAGMSDYITKPVSVEARGGEGTRMHGSDRHDRGACAVAGWADCGCLGEFSFLLLCFSHHPPVLPAPKLLPSRPAACPVRPQIIRRALVRAQAALGKGALTTND